MSLPIEYLIEAPEIQLPPGLYSWQEPLVKRMVEIVKSKRICLNLSEMGTGKTVQTVATCKVLNKRPFIVCPKSVMLTWQKVCDRFNVKPIAIVNYETIKLGKIYYGGTRANTAYITKEAGKYQWSLPLDACLIMDEVHKCKNLRSDNGKLLLSVKQCPYVILLTGTMVESLDEIKIFAYLCREVDDLSNFNRYKKIHGLTRCRQKLADFIVQIKISELVMFPKNQVIIRAFAPSQAATSECKRLAKLLEKKPTPHVLTKIQKLKQSIELSKTGIFVEQAQLALAGNNSVVIFVNYLDTMRVILEALGTQCYINGQQTVEEKEACQTAFQTDEARVIVCQMRVIGIDLHDVTGKHPRFTLLSIPESGTELEQALGRTYRAGCQSHVLQTIVVTDDPYELEMVESLVSKVANLNCIHERDSSYL